MDVTIRKVHKNSIYRDELMKDYPCFIIIKGNHNHPTDSDEALNQLHVLPSTKKMFEKYFAEGKLTYITLLIQYTFVIVILLQELLNRREEIGLLNLVNFYDNMIFLLI